MKRKVHPDTVRLDWLTKQTRINFTGLHPGAHGSFVRYGDRFGKGIRQTIDAAIRADKRKK